MNGSTLLVLSNGGTQFAWGGDTFTQLEGKMLMESDENVITATLRVEVWLFCARTTAVNLVRIDAWLAD